MKLPRDISSEDLIFALKRLGYSPTRQAGSHIRLTTLVGGEHHVSVPRHANLSIGVIGSILRDVGEHARLDRVELYELLFRN